MKDYKKKQQDKQAELCHICCGEETGGKYILSDVWNNIFHGIREKVEEADKFKEIKWWKSRKPTGNMCSSQVACINHLFSFRFEIIEMPYWQFSMLCQATRENLKM